MILKGEKFGISQQLWHACVVFFTSLRFPPAFGGMTSGIEDASATSIPETEYGRRPWEIVRRGWP
jgi:hypothetical protein